jgi:transposase-like protein
MRGFGAGLATAERKELRRLRRENRILREEREMLKQPREVLLDFTGTPQRAAAFFARETDSKP